MNIFKYLFLVFALISINTYAACESGINKDLDVPVSIINSPQSYVCNNSCRYRLKSCVDVDIEGPNGICSAVSTGQACSGSNPNPVDPEPEPTELQCTANSCLNPNNLRCPTGYSSGSFNGQNMCIKNDSPDPDPEPCEGDECLGNQQGIIDAVNNANASITNEVGNLNGSLSGSLNAIRDKLAEIADKITNLASNNGNNNGGESTGPVDTSGFDADVPFYDLEQKELDQNLFSYSAQCPADSVLNMNFMGSSFTYRFSYDQICDALHSLSYLVMIFAYLLSAYIVSRP